MRRFTVMSAIGALSVATVLATAAPAAATTPAAEATASTFIAPACAYCWSEPDLTTSLPPSMGADTGITITQ